MNHKLFKIANLQGGISLIEILIALVVIAVGLAGYIKLHAIFMGNSTLAQQRTEAVQLAEQKLESFRNYAVVNTTSGFSAYADITSGNTSTTSINATYNIAWTVTENTTLNYKTITVTVNWQRPDATTESISVSSIISRYNPANSGYIFSV